MTTQRFDKHSTEFGLWIRKIRDIDSALGYLATNIDFFWKNYKTKKFMFIEEKRYMSWPKQWQMRMFQQIHNAFQQNPLYKGFYILQFENTSPDDGKIYLNKKEISESKLIEFLTMK